MTADFLALDLTFKLSVVEPATLPPESHLRAFLARATLYQAMESKWHVPVCCIKSPIRHSVHAPQGSTYAGARRLIFVSRNWMAMSIIKVNGHEVGIQSISNVQNCSSLFHYNFEKILACIYWAFSSICVLNQNDISLQIYHSYCNPNVSRATTIPLFFHPHEVSVLH